VVETAVYAVVAEAAWTATGPLAVSGEHDRDRLSVTVETALDGGRLDLRALEDRVGALDGTLRVEHGNDGRTTIRAELPCES